MAETRPYTTLQGILIPSVLFDASVAVTSQAGPVPAVPTPATSNAASGLLETTGTQDSTTREVYVSQAGLPGPHGAEVLWRESGDTADEWRGWNPPSVIRETEGLWDDLPAATWSSSWDAVQCSNGTLVCVSRITDAAFSYYASAYWTQAAGWVESGSNIVTHAGGSTTTEVAVAFVPGETVGAGRVLCFALARMGGISNTLNVEVWSASETTPNTWTVWSRNVLSADAAISPTRARAAYSNGLICLLVGVNGATNYINQYVSEDGGASFRLVESWSGTEEAGAFDLAALPDGRLALVYTCEDVGDTKVYMRVIGSPAQPFQASTKVEVEDVQSLQVSVAATEDGERLVVVVDGGTGVEGQVWVDYYDVDNLTATGKKTWNQGLIATDDAATCHNLVCRFAGGHLHAFTRIDETGGAAGRWLSTWRCGGWTNRPMPRWFSATEGTGRIAWGRSVPFPSGAAPTLWSESLVASSDNATAALSPESRGWALAIGGATVGTDLATASWEWDFSGGANHGSYYQDASGGTNAGGMIVGWQMRVVSGGSVASADIAVRVTLADGANEARVTARFSGVQVRLYDEVAGASIDLQTFNATNWYSYVMALVADEVHLWGYAAGASLPTVHATGAVTTTAVGPSAANRVRWGQIDASTASSRWRWVGYVCGVDTSTIGQDLIDQGEPLHATDSDLDEPGRSLPAAGHAYLDDLLLLRGTRGPLAVADTYTLAPAYQYPATAVLPRIEASPRRGWRSTDDAVEQTMTWILPAAESVGPTLGIVFVKPNFADAYWEGWTGAAWATIATINLRAAISLDYARQNTILIPNGATPGATRYFARDELVGGYVILNGGATVRPIVGNTEGSWGVSTTTKTMRIRITSDNTEPASGSDMDIIPPIAGVVIHEQSTARTRFRLRIAACTCYEGYHALGSLAVGPVAVFGSRVARGRVVATEHGATVSRTPSRFSSVRVDAPVRRTMTLDPGERDLTPISTSPPSATYLTGSDAGVPVATYRDLHMLLEGVIYETDGPSVPVVYLPAIPRGAGTLTLHGREQMLYGLIESGASRTTSLGDESSDEVVTGERIVIVEEP